MGKGDVSEGEARRTAHCRDPRPGGVQRVVAVYRGYADAEHAIGALADRGFPVDRAAIVALGPEAVERATGRLSTGGVVAWAGASGLVVGAAVGWLLGWFDWLLGWFDLAAPLVATAWLALNGALLGGVLGAVIGLVGYAATHGRRSSTAEWHGSAAHYDVRVDAELADRAVRILHSPAADRDDGSRHPHQ